MKSELTLQDILKYHNAEIYYQSEKYKIYSVNIITEHIELIHSQYWDMDVLDENSFTDVICISDCKLILRDITEPTDEEKRFIVDNFVFELFKDAIGVSNWNSFDELFAIGENKMGLIDYLREKDVMIEKEDWFKSGKAVKK